MRIHRSLLTTLVGVVLAVTPAAASYADEHHDRHGGKHHRRHGNEQHDRRPQGHHDRYRGLPAQRHDRHHVDRRWHFEPRGGWRYYVRPDVWSPRYVWWWSGGQVILRPVPVATVVQYPQGRYELRGDGIGVPYYWLWVPAVVVATPPPVVIAPPPPPAPPFDAAGIPPLPPAPPPPPAGIPAPPFPSTP